MLANARTEYAFTIVDPAVAPRSADQPKTHAMALWRPCGRPADRRYAGASPTTSLVRAAAGCAWQTPAHKRSQ